MAVAIKKSSATDANVAPHWHAQAKEIQKYGSVIADMPHPLNAKVRADMVAQLNQLLADSILSVICTKNITGRYQVRPFTNCISCLISISTSR
jgi:hypothetical protein